MRTALVTGGAGFIGSHLAEYLVMDGWNVRILDNLSTGTPANLAGLSCDLIEADICDEAACVSACRDVDTVFHLAAAWTTPDSTSDPRHAAAVNIGGTLNMLTAARAAGVRRFVFSSSAVVYGDSYRAPVNERLPLDPQSMHAVTKASGEIYCRNFTTLYGLETVILRYFNVYGPRQVGKSGHSEIVPRFVRAALAGDQPVIYGDGRQTRDFVYVRDVARINCRAATARGVVGQAFNVGSGHETTLLDLLALLSRISGTELSPRFDQPRADEIRDLGADIERAHEHLGFEPIYSLYEGLQQCYAHAARGVPFVTSDGLQFSGSV